MPVFSVTRFIGSSIVMYHSSLNAENAGLPNRRMLNTGSMARNTFRMGIVRYICGSS